MHIEFAALMASGGRTLRESLSESEFSHSDGCEDDGGLSSDPDSNDDDLDDGNEDGCDTGDEANEGEPGSRMPCLQAPVQQCCDTTA